MKRHYYSKYETTSDIYQWRVYRSKYIIIMKNKIILQAFQIDMYMSPGLCRSLCNLPLACGRENRSWLDYIAVSVDLRHKIPVLHIWFYWAANTKVLWMIITKKVSHPYKSEINKNKIISLWIIARHRSIVSVCNIKSS